MLTPNTNERLHLIMKSNGRQEWVSRHPPFSFHLLHCLEYEARSDALNNSNHQWMANSLNVFTFPYSALSSASDMCPSEFDCWQWHYKSCTICLEAPISVWVFVVFHQILGNGGGGEGPYIQRSPHLPPKSIKKDMIKHTNTLMKPLTSVSPSCALSSCADPMPCR